MYFQSLSRITISASFLLGTAFLPAHAQYIMATRPQAGLGRELSNPFPVVDIALATADFLLPDGTSAANTPLPSHFVAFRVDVTINMTNRQTDAGNPPDFQIPSNAKSDINPPQVYLSSAGTGNRRYDINNQVELNYNQSDDSLDFGKGNFSAMPTVNTMTTLSALVYLRDDQSQGLIASLTPGGILHDGNTLAPNGFKVFVGPGNGANNARYYHYDTTANYRVYLYTTNPVPEPGTVALLGGAALVGSGMVLRRRRR